MVGVVVVVVEVVCSRGAHLLYERRIFITGGYNYDKACGDGWYGYVQQSRRV